MPKIVNSFDPAGTLTSILPREGIDIGPTPNFWDDFGEMFKRFRRPAAQAAAPAVMRQSRAIRSAAPPREGMSPGGSSGSRRLAPSARQFGRPALSPQGVWGTYVNPLDIPADLMGTLPTGFFTDDPTSNYTYSPTVNPSRYATGQTQREQRR